MTHEPTTPFVVGIDPSLSNTAICCYWPATGEAKMVCRTAGKPTDDLGGRIERYETFVDQILHVITRVGSPVGVLIEHYSFNSKNTRAWQTGEWGYLLRYRLYERRPTPVEIPPGTLKQFATGRGNASKTQVVAALTKRYGVEYKTDDEYDAYGLARLAACLAGLEEPETQWQAAVVAKLRERRPAP